MKGYQKIIRLITGMAVSCIGAAFIGIWVDNRLHTTPIVLLLLLAYAIGGNLYLIVKALGDEHE